MKLCLRYLLTMGLSLSLLISHTIISFAGSWKKQPDGWRYQKDDGSYYASSWFQDYDKQWYYFDANGYMQTGWIFQGNNYYYLSTSGAMLSDTTTPDGYFVGSDGAYTESVPSSNSWKRYSDFVSLKDSGPSVSDGFNKLLSYQVIDLVNEERAAYGLSPLVLNQQLIECAEKRAIEITNSFSHIRPNNSSCFSILKEHNFTYALAGENIAQGQKTAEAVMADWMKSTGHKNNILKADYTEIGVGCYIINGRRHWVQIFTKK